MINTRLFCTSTVDIPIEQLVSWRGGRYRDAVQAIGICPYDRPVALTPHYEAVQSFENAAEIASVSTYVRHFDRLIAVGRTKRNDGEPIISGKVRLARFHQLFHTIRADGHITPLSVNAEHDGRFRIRDGLHRAAIALRLGHSTVPAKIVAVDRQLKTLLSLVHADWPHKQRILYQPIEHPLFNDWPTTRYEDRWEMMAPTLDWSGRSILDVGSCTGFFSRAAERYGATVTGVETDRRRHRIARELNALLGARVEYVLKDFREVVGERQFDVILFLSVLHWVLKSEGMAGVEQCLKQLCESAPVLYLDLAARNESKMRTQAWSHGIHIDLESIPRIVTSCSNYLHWQLLGVDRRGRALFKFWRNA